MTKWNVGYYIGNTYTYKYVYADTAAQAIKKARIKNIVELYPVEENRTRGANNGKITYQVNRFGDWLCTICCGTVDAA